MPSEFIRRGGKPFGVVPFGLMECRRLSLQARLVACWIESKPEDWIVRPDHLQAVLGIGEKAWLSARREMIAAGIFQHSRNRTASGKWVWESVFDATKLVAAHEATIPPLAAHGEGRDIETRKEEQELSDLRTKAQTAAKKPAAVSAPRNSPCLDTLEQMHIGYTLNDLGIGWDETANYVTWGDYSRARVERSGHWTWCEQGTDGDSMDAAGTAIDLIMHETGCTQAEAISRLKRIHREAVNK